MLASGSPRRRELLALLGLDFEVLASGVNENLPGWAPIDLARRLAEDKARASAALAGDGLVLGADTTIDLDGREVGKPLDDADAVRILRSLRGRWHSVITGVAVFDCASGGLEVSSVRTGVLMRDYSEAEIAAYVASGEPLDRAGAYAIQELGGRLVERIEGCYTNVVGLPLCETARLLENFGVSARPRSPVCRLPDGQPCPRLAVV